MKNNILLVIILMFLLSCKGNGQEKETGSKNDIDFTSSTLLGVTKTDSIYTVYYRCDGGYPVLRFEKNNFYFYDPQEGAHYIIKDIVSNKDKYTINTSGYYFLENEKVSSQSDTWFLERQNDLLWTFKNSKGGKAITLSDSLNIGRKKIAYSTQPCEVCGNCNEIDLGKAGKVKNTIPISSLFDSNQLTKQWSNHCEKGADKDNIMFYSSEEISFNITSINFICGATSKQTDDKTIEIYLKDSGTDYAPNGEVYSNNNLPKGINFDDISQDKPVAQVKILNKDSVELSWLGFYNKKTNKREYLSNPFDKSKNTVVLSRCTE